MRNALHDLIACCGDDRECVYLPCLGSMWANRVQSSHGKQTVIAQPYVVRLLLLRAFGPLEVAVSHNDAAPVVDERAKGGAREQRL